MKRINLFATKDDLLLILRRLEASRAIKYTHAGRIYRPAPGETFTDLHESWRVFREVIENDVVSHRE